jgi:hypothetical protein
MSITAAVAGEAADPRVIPAHHEPVAVVLDFVDPQGAGRWPRHLRRLARFDEAGGTPHGHGWRITAVQRFLFGSALGSRVNGDK